MKKRPMVLIFTGMLSGTAVVWNVMSVTTAFYILLGICFLAICIYGDKRYIFIIGGVVFGIVFSIFSKASMELDFLQIKKYNGQYITARVIEISKTKKGKQALLLKQEDLEGKILLYTSSDKQICQGDFVAFGEKIEIWEEAANPGQFSNRYYYFSKRIYYHAYAKDVEIIKHTRSCFGEVIMQCRNYVKKQLSIQYDEDVRNFLNGMILGDKTELREEVKDDFKKSGLIHLLAVSGLHISLAGRSIYRMLRKLCGSFVISSIFGIAGAIFYCILTGMSVSSLRAVIMLSIYFLSQIIGEHYDMMSSASVAGVVLLLLCPYRIYDTGFLYSFTAVFVIASYQMIKPKIKGKFQKLKESILFCFFVQIGMFPVMIYFQYESPIFSFLANVAAVPLASAGFTLAFLFVTLPNTILHKMVSILIKIVLWISERSYGMLTIGCVPFLWVILYYVILYLCTIKNNKIQFKIRIGVIYIALGILICVPIFRKKTIAFLDVGQGDCFMADTSAGLIVSDGGSSSVDQVGKYRMLPYMKYLGYQKAKIAIISHMDKDHYSGILELLEMGRVEYLGLPDVTEDKTMEKIMKTAHQNKTKIFYLSKGRKIQTKDIFLEVLHPVKNSSMDKNAASLVLQGEALGYRILLTGDVEKEGEEELLLSGLGHADILKAAHHGSKNSTSNEFLKKVLPQQTIISCGKNNRYGHPHNEVLCRLKIFHTKILRTDKKGAIIFSKKRDS